VFYNDVTYLFQQRKVATMILTMGGSIRKDMGLRVTHLITSHCSGEKYRYADTFGLPIMSIEWVTALWDAKDNITIHAEDLVSMDK